MSEVKSDIREAFLLGVGFGQALLEQSMENDLSGAFIQGLAGRKFGGVHHDVSIPNKFDINNKGEIVNVRPDYEGKYVRYKLRSDEWRKANFKSKVKLLEIIEKY